MKLKSGSQGDVQANGAIATSPDKADNKKLNGLKVDKSEARKNLAPSSSPVGKKSRRSWANGSTSSSITKDVNDYSSLFDQISFKAKLVGSEFVEQAKSEEIAIKSFAVLKKKVNATKGHKTRILVTLSLKEGIKISTNDTKAGKTRILLQCQANKITYHIVDKSCQRTFGFVVSTADLKYQFFAIKMEKSAANIKAAVDDLLTVLARIVEKTKRESGHTVQSATLQLQAERPIDVPSEQQKRLKEHINAENKLKLPEDMSLSNIALNDVFGNTTASTTAGFESSNSTDASSIHTSEHQTTYQQNRGRQSGRKFRGAFAKLFGSKRRGTSMIDISGKEHTTEVKSSAAARKSLQIESKKTLQKHDRVSRSMVNVNSGAPEMLTESSQSGTKNAPNLVNGNSEKIVQKNGQAVKESAISQPSFDFNQILTPEPAHTKVTSQTNFDGDVMKMGTDKMMDNTATNVSQLPVTVDLKSDPFGVQSFDEPVSCSGFDSDWASFDNPSSSIRDIPSDQIEAIVADDSANPNVQSKSSPLWFDSTFLSQTTAELTQSFTQISSSTPVAMNAPKQKESQDLLNIGTNQTAQPSEINNNKTNLLQSNENLKANGDCVTSTNNGINSAFDPFNDGSVEIPPPSNPETQSGLLTDVFGQDEMFSSFALTSEAREQLNDFNDIAFDNFETDVFSFTKNKKTESGHMKYGGKKSKSAFDLLLLGNLEQSNFDVFSDEIDIDSDGGNSSPYDMRASSAMDREVSLSAWNFNDDGIQTSLDPTQSRSRQFFMRPTSVSGCQSVSNFSSAFTGSQNRLNKPDVKKMDILERPFDDDPFFAS